MISIKQKNVKEIIALNTFEAVRLRPTMYLGQVAHVDEKLPIIRDGTIQSVDKTWSPGFMHLIIEILENAIDEAKRMKGKMRQISVMLNLDTNEVIIKDTGNGFYKATSMHKKTKKSVIRTAFEELHAGSNFTDSSTNILGTHGVGAAVVNIVSKTFKVTTVNRTHVVDAEWNDFQIVKEVKSKNEGSPLGTKVSFVPSKEVFSRYKWDLELVQTYLSYKSFLISMDPKIKNLKLTAEYVQYKQRRPIKIERNFVPKDHIRVDNKEYGSIFLWENYPGSASLSFVNGSQCTGTHQRIVNDWANEFFDYSLAHHFYETLIVLNVPSNLMRFADQNKTKFATSKLEIEGRLKYGFYNSFMRKLKNSRITVSIERKVEDKLFNENIKKIKKEKRLAKRTISEKYSAASKRKKNLYITEGLSAAGSVKQARDSTVDGVYALKGKIKNTRNLRDLTENKEILEIMSILDLEPGKTNVPMYENIIIATDEDPDGQHIASLIVNLFWKWFPHIITEGRLYKLVTPLVAATHSGGTRKRKYFYTLQEFDGYRTRYKMTSINYLKGLGSLSLDDWEFVMRDKVMFQIQKDDDTDKFLDIAFGRDSALRKLWLQGIV